MYIHISTHIYGHIIVYFNIIICSVKLNDCVCVTK